MNLDSAPLTRLTRSLPSAWYIFPFYIIPLTALTSCLWSTTLPWFLSHNGYPTLRVTGYSLRLRNADCQVLIYGDSTAMAGLNSAIIQQRTGLKTCNISEIRPVENFVGVEFPLDQYLAHNRPPKYIVSSWTPPTLTFFQPRMSLPKKDGFVYALQYDRGPWLWRGMARNADASINFLVWALRSEMGFAIQKLLHSSHGQNIDPRRIRDDAAGTYTFPLPPQNGCAPTATGDSPPPHDYSENRMQVAEFRQHYQTNGTRVLVDVSPLAECSDIAEQARQLTSDITDNQLELRPVTNFNLDNTHLTAEGAKHFSYAVAEQIRQLQLADAAGHSPQRNP